MQSPIVIEHHDVIENVLLCLSAGLVVPPLHAFFLQAREEALRDRIVPAVSLAAHAANEAICLEQTPVGFAGVLGEFNRSSQHL